MEGLKNSDNKKEEGKKLLGRVDNIYWSEPLSLYFVKDDFERHVLFDCAIGDLDLLTQELIKVVSYYINK